MFMLSTVGSRLDTILNRVVLVGVKILNILIPESDIPQILKCESYTHKNQLLSTSTFVLSSIIELTVMLDLLPGMWKGGFELLTSPVSV